MIDYTKVQFTSSTRYEHISTKGSVTAPISVGGGDTAITIPHNLGYPPFALLFVQLPGDPNVYPIIEDPNTYFGAALFEVDGYTYDTENIYLSLLAPLGAGAGDYTVYYRIYAEPQL